MEKKETHIAVVLDRSASMSSVREETIEAFNEQIEEIKENAEKGGRTRVSFYTFGGHYGNAETLDRQPPPAPPYVPGPDQQKLSAGSCTTKRLPVETLFTDRDPDILEPLTYESYVPEGLTPMYDGIGKAILDLKEKDDGARQQAFLVIVVSDGQENHSRKWTADRISDEVTALQNTGRWTFVFLGANVDLSEVEGSLSFQPGNIAAFTASADGVKDLGAGMRHATASYMASRSVGQTQDSAYGEDVSAKTEESSSDGTS